MCCKKKYTPLNCSAHNLSSSSSLTSSSLVIGAHPVQLTAMSSRPARSTAKRASAATSALRVTSQAQYSPPSCWARARSGASPRPATTTRAPSPAKRRAITCPILPSPAAPSTTATLPLMRPMVFPAVNECCTMNGSSLEEPQGFGAVPAVGGALHETIELQQVGLGFVEFDHVAEFARRIDHGKCGAGRGACFERHCRARCAHRVQGFAQIRHEVRDVVDAHVFACKQIAQHGWRVVVLRDQLDHDITGLAVSRGVVEDRGHTAITAARERNVREQEERTPA